jgi:hypothetical protein
MGEIRNADIILMRKLEEKRPLGRCRHSERTLKCILWHVKVFRIGFSSILL